MRDSPMAPQLQSTIASLNNEVSALRESSAALEEERDGAFASVSDMQMQVRPPCKCHVHEHTLTTRHKLVSTPAYLQRR